METKRTALKNNEKSDLFFASTTGFINVANPTAPCHFLLGGDDLDGYVLPFKLAEVILSEQSSIPGSPLPISMRSWRDDNM